jgi:hypothetical protein
MTTVERICACGAKYTARLADIKRGWAKSCSKSCAATKREKRTGTFAAYSQRQRDSYYRRKYGGDPQYDSKGEYVGFTAGFSNEDHDCNKE